MVCESDRMQIESGLEPASLSRVLQVTHFLLLKTKLKIKQTIVKTMPAVAKRTSTAVVAGCTVTVVFTATPSRGKPSKCVYMVKIS